MSEVTVTTSVKTKAMTRIIRAGDQRFQTSSATIATISAR